MVTLVRSVLLIPLSTGWLVPLWLACHFFLESAQQDAIERAGGHVPITSFPYLHEADDMVAVAFLWLAVAIGYWVVQCVKGQQLRRPA
ncbi:MAG TPA: hypothetical protein VOA87_08790 [Thermoanaerobaculia bacterium]|nr:hypothetical protein [Thermoanaerobaculia bacterium]